MKKSQLLAVRLYFFKQTGCPHCAMAEPDVVRFQRRHPRVSVIHTRSDGVDGFEPAGTPAYLIKVNDKQAFTHVGRLTLKELEEAYKEGIEEYTNAEEAGFDGADAEEEKAESLELRERQAREEEE